MRKSIVKGKGLWVLALALAVVLLVTACAPAETGLGEGKTVAFAAIEPITGGASATIQDFMLGVHDYTRYFNEEEGIPDVTIEALWADDALQFAQFMSAYQRFVANGVPIIRIMEADALEWVGNRCAKDNVVVFGSTIGIETMSYSPKGCRYFLSPTQAEQFAVVAKYFMENWEEQTPPKLAFVAIDNVWGQELQGKGRKYAQSLGFEVLPSETVPFVVLDATTELLRLRDQGADFVYLQVLVSGTTAFLRDAERPGLLGEMHFAGGPSGISSAAIEFAGIASEGYLVSMQGPWFDETEVSGIRLMLDQQMKYRGKVVKNMAYQYGWVETAAACEAIRRAIDNVGYDNVDSAAIKEALDNMEGFDVNGLATITYKDRPLDRRGITRVAVYQVQDGNMVRATDWREVPSLVPEGLVRE